MPCRTYKNRVDGSTVIACSRGKQPPLCSVPSCGERSVALCDYPVERYGRPVTCDSPMCAGHRHTIAKGE